ncbi:MULTISPECIES: hypothetical protein [Streptomyces]|uniref:Lipoprotein n=2 Tax=Streptomyces TaxID=1883 RepID=A0ABU4KCG9_9ACTN|nr:hypothetical protein [Streptomyces roseolus]MDX2295479.1 hypothetical protein [Streptomyces roseolus]
MFRTTRAPAAFAALLGLVLGLLVCGAPAPGGGTAPGTVPGKVSVVVGAAVPGCDPGRPADLGDEGPVVPPRAQGFAELLPVLAADRPASAVRQPDPCDPAAAPGREPPARAPSPVELSVLRV